MKEQTLRRLCCVCVLSAGVFSCDKSTPAPTTPAEQKAPIAAVVTAVPRVRPVVVVRDAGRAKPPAQITALGAGGTTTMGSDAGASVIQIQRMEFARAIESRNPVGTALPFTTNDERIYTYFEATNSGEVPDAIVVTFVRPNGKVQGRPLRLDVPAVRRAYHTWAFARVNRTAGTWTAIIADSAGLELRRTTFDVVDAPAATDQ